ncbi:MAG: MFS transporter [Bdellovibrionales bacterium]|nr:MFS transporter [Bdellovibrionales bacterium]
MRKTLKALPKTVWLIGFISLVNDSASEMIYPILPLYLSSVLMAGPKAIGWIEGVAESTASLLKLFSGVIMDRTRRSKPWMVFGYGIAGLGRPLIAFIGSWPMLLLIRFADRIGKGLRSAPRDTLLASSVPADQRGLVFGFHRAMDNAGAVIGPVVAYLMLSAQVPLRSFFLWSIIPASLCLILTLSLHEPSPSAPPISGKIRWSLDGMPVAFKRYLVVIGLFSLGNSSNMFLLLRASELGVPKEQVPLIWAMVSAVATLFSTPLAAWSDRIGRGRLLLFGYLAFGAYYFALGTVQTTPRMVFWIFPLYGIFVAATEGVERALVADLAPEARRGTAFGWFNLISGIFLLPASVLFGWLYQSVSPSMAFGFSAACAVISSLLLRFWVGLRDLQTSSASSRVPD